MNVLIMNTGAGSFQRDPALARAVVELARRRDAHIEICECDPGAVAAMCARAARRGADVVAVCGGDGSISAAAGALMGTGAALAVVPTGTLNHFARDLRVPTAIDAALTIALRGCDARVDLGRVNDRVFINNSSLGVYPHIVQVRERRSGALERLGSLAAACSRVWQRFPTERVRLQIDTEPEVEVATPLLFVGNNQYGMTLGELGTRARLDAGVLSVCIATSESQLGLLGHAVLTALVGPESAPAVDCVTARRLRVCADAPGLPVGVDGEAVDMDGTLDFRTMPGALRVRVPSARAA